VLCLLHHPSSFQQSIALPRVPQKLKLASWNSHSVKNKLGDISEFVARDHIDVLAINETWLSGAIKSSTLGVRNFNLAFRRDRPTAADDTPLTNYGGVCVYIRKNVQCVRMPELEHDDQEAIWFRVVGGKSDVVVCAFYRAPNRNRREFIEYIDHCLNILGPTREVVLLGDVNMNFERDADCAALKLFLSVYGFEQLIKDGSHIYNAHQSSIIDVICCNRPQKVITSRVLDYEPNLLEYHKPVMVEYLLDLPPLKVTKHTARNFCEQNIQNFLQRIGSVTWAGNTADEAVTFMNQTLATIVDLSFPLKSFVTTDKTVPEITPEIRQAKAEKYRLLKIKRRTGREEDRVAFNRQSDYLNWLCMEHRKAIISREININFDSSRKLWQTLKQYLSIDKSKDRHSVVLTVDGIKQTDPRQIANTFNEYFCAVGEQLAAQLPNLQVDPLQFVDEPADGSVFALHPVTRYEVLREAQKIGAHKSVAEPAPFKVLKSALHFLAIPITNIINLSFADAEVPRDLKRAVVSCIYKDGDKEECSNYRPISVLTLAGKLIESIVQKRLASFVNRKNILYRYQSAYRANHSCEMALNETLSKIYAEVDQGNEAVVVFLDLKKAFDTIDRNILFRKLERYGVRGHALKWFRSALSDRSQCVKVDSILSECRPNTVGIPQGSSLGPLLFSLYINDVYNASNIPTTLLFADDTALVFTGDLSSETINASLSNFWTWMTVNKLTLNCNKTKFMVFSKRRKNFAIPALVMNNIQIEQVSSIKYLGVLIDDKLSFGPHITSIAKKLGHLHSVIYNNRSIISTPVGEILLTALAIPRLCYASTVFHRASDTSLRELDILFRKMLKIVYRLPYDAPSAEVYSGTKFLPLCLIRQIQCAQFAFRCLIGECADYLQEKIQTTGNLRRRPHRDAALPVELFAVPRRRLLITEQSYLQWCPAILNAVPRDIIDSAIRCRQPIKAFTEKYRSYIRLQFELTVWSRELETSRRYLV
jgi:exonuclease III